MFKLRSFPPATPLSVVVACRTLAYSARLLCTANPVHEEIREPIDLRKYTNAQIVHLVKQLPDYHREKTSPSHIAVLGTGGNELSPSFILKCYSRCYRFNIGEGFTRMTTSHQFHVSKNPLSLFTRAHWDNCGGAGQIYQMHEEKYEKQEYLGPAKMQSLMSYVQWYTGKLTWVGPRTETSNGDGVRRFVDENLTISVVPVDVEGGPASAGTVVAYACKLHDSPGKFFPEKAAVLGIPPGPAYKVLAEGYSVITEQGDLVHSSQVMGEGKKGPTFVVVDCPTKSFSKALTCNQYLQPDYYDGLGHRVALVVHITPLDVLQSESYCKWMSGFERDTQHLLLHSSLCPGEMGYRHNTKFNMALHLLNPKVYPFPCPPLENILDKNNLKISKYISKDSVIFGRMFLKYNLKHERGVDDAGCLTDLKEELKSDLESTMTNLKFYNKLLAHRKLVCGKDTVKVKSVVPSLMKTGYSVKPADVDDAVVTMLGTSASYPTKHRNCSGILVQTLQDGNFLLDCCEGTLQQLYRCFGTNETRNILKRMNMIFISHPHPDHHMGLISVLNEIHALTAKDSGDYVKVILSTQQARYLESTDVCDKLQLRIVNPFELPKAPYPCSDAITMETVQVKHIKYSFGCVLRRKGKWSIVYSGDTAPTQSLVEAGKNATLLIHEATFEDDLEGEARKRNHSTYSDAMRIGRAMNAHFTITTHFSSRQWWAPMLKQHRVKKMAPAVDFMTVRLSDLHDQQLDSPSSCAALHVIAQACAGH